MSNRGIPEGWSTSKDSSIGYTNQFPRSQLPVTPGSQPPEDGDSVSRPVPRPNVDPAPPSVDFVSPHQSSSLHKRQPTAEAKDFVGESPSQQPVPPGGVAPPPPNPKRRGWLKNWVFWAAFTGLMSSGIGFGSIALLLKLPAAPNCPSIFWPMASASVRLQCAQVAASKQTVNDLLEAITLVQALRSDHPLRQEINGLLEHWSLDILDLADEAFQAGKLQEAIAIASKIPQDVPAYQSVKERISSWQSIWSAADEIYRNAEVEIRQQHWHQAYMTAVRLLNIENNYWTTTKYEELKNRIETTREDAKKLAQAQSLEQKGGLDNLLAALKLAESIGASSYIYQDAQDTVLELGNQMLELAQEKLEGRDADEAIAIANKISANSVLQSEAQDFVTIVSAWRSAWNGTIPSLSAAIEIAQNIGYDRPLYNKAQELISRWQLEIEDVSHLQRARELAQGGTIGDLTPAIAEAELIPDNNPRAQEAKQEINRWRRQVQTIEDQPYLSRALELAIPEDINSLQAAIIEASQVTSDRALYQEAQSKIRNWTRKIQQIQDQPYLDRANQIVNLEDVNSLQAAINEASQIASGRALYQEAQSKIRNWTRKIEQIQDQPYLDQARFLASNGNLGAAITAAQQIQPGRALSREAQAAVNDWQAQIRATQDWQLARRLALSGTPDALKEAINQAERVPTTSPLRIAVNAAIEQWSKQLLRMAQNRGEYDIPGGIAIAKLIPPNTDAYQAAQEQIELWQKFLNPPAPEISPAPSAPLP